MSISDEPRGRRAFEVDERLIMPETRYEVIDGEVVYVSPADQPHGSRHSKLSAILEAYVGDDFDAACDMLTRTSEKNDFAPDGSVYPAAPDPETGGRQLEQLAFEVVSTESLSHAGRKAAELVARGVRRVFALDVERQRALEWSTETAAWSLLHNDAVIDDPAFVIPLPIHALVSAAKADDAVARALLAKANPVLGEELDRREAKGLAKGEAKGEAKGLADAVLMALATRGLRPTSSEEMRVRACSDAATLRRWLVRAITAGTVAEALDG